MRALKRRTVLGAMSALGAAALAGCATGPAGSTERIVELRSGRTLTRAELLAAMRASEVVLLGERHDNPHHHAVRGELIESLGVPAVVVAEHLTRPLRVRFGDDLLASLQAAGFDPKGWRWPLHQPLFAALQRAGLPLVGGNLPRETVRQIARVGDSAWPADLAALLARAPFSGEAQAALDADLLAGHCGHLDAKRLPGLRAAQRARDASMFLALRDAGTSPALLLAGNGHVRLDYGVGQLFAALAPQVRLLSVGFLEADEPLALSRTRYTHAVVTPGAQRGDPCQGFPVPAKG